MIQYTEGGVPKAKNAGQKVAEKDLCQWRQTSYFESEDILEDFWKHLDLDTSGNKNATESYAKLMGSITKSKVEMVMPKTFEEAESVRGTKAAMLSVPTAIKS